MAPHVFTEAELLSTDAADVQVDVHVFLQLFSAGEDLETHLANGFPGRQVGDHVSDVVVFEEGSLVADRAHVARHAFVHVGVQPELAFPQKLLPAGLAGELLLLGVDGVVLSQVAALIEAFATDAAEVFTPVIWFTALLQQHRAEQFLVVTGQGVLKRQALVLEKKTAVRAGQVGRLQQPLLHPLWLLQQGRLVLPMGV